MQKRNVLNSPRLTELKRHRRRSFLNKIILLFFGAFVIFIFLVYISRLSSLNINDIEVTGNQVIDTEAIKSTAEQQITGKYLGLFPKSDIFLYPENTIINELQDKYKRLENITLSIKNNKTLKISVAERKALYTWCGITPSNSTDVDIPQSGSSTSVTNCYFVDENGFIFDKAPYFSGDVYFKFYGTPDDINATEADFDPSGFYFSKNNFKQLISFRDILVGLKLKPVSLFVTKEGDVRVTLSSINSSIIGPQILCKLGDDYQKDAENLEAALTTEPLQSEFKNKYSSLLYIDLRFGNKVYYKFSTQK